MFEPTRRLRPCLHSCATGGARLSVSLGAMTTPRQFIESFLQEETAASAPARTNLSAVYNKYFGEPMSPYAEYLLPSDQVPVVDDVEQSDTVARVVVREHLRNADIRRCYRLAASGANWKIVGLDRECLICFGTGQSGGSHCSRCNGQGWCVLFPKVA